MEEVLSSFSDGEEWEQRWSCSGSLEGTKLGYAGTAILTRLPVAGRSPRAMDLSTRPGLAEDRIVQGEGRHITLEFDRFVLVTAYVPNSGAELARLDYRLHQWDPALARHLRQLELETGKPVILAGDLNVALNVRDIHHMYKRPNFPEGLEAVPYEEQYKGLKAITTSAGLTPEERTSFQKHYLDVGGGDPGEEEGEGGGLGFVDAFRHCHPDATGVFSYWSQRARARRTNRGLRLDYFLCSPSLCCQGPPPAQGHPREQLRVADSCIYDDEAFAILSDHCAVGLTLAAPAS